jgi:hypothetical protein
MPGRQLNFSIRGEQYEKAFDAIASRFLSVVRVPRPGGQKGEAQGTPFWAAVVLPLEHEVWRAEAIAATTAGLRAYWARSSGVGS